MTATLQRRLPGVRFDVPAPALREALPRMDIALFVGFAACGPVGLPVAVESLAEFETVFGPEITLLEQPDGSPLRGLLHGSMRLFFGHGGRRAWVVRVAAASARTTRFALQQMLLLRRPTGNTGPWHGEPAWIAARCPGSWADGLTVATTIDAQPLAVTPLAAAAGTLTLSAIGPLALALARDDLLRLTLADGEWLQGFVAAADAAGAGADGRLRRRIVLDRLASLRSFTHQPAALRIGWFEPTLRGDGSVAHHAAAESRWQDDGRVALQARVPARTRIGVGELLHVTFAGAHMPAWLVVEEVDATAIAAADGQVELRLLGRPWHVPGTLHRQPLDHWLAARDERSAAWLRAGLRAMQPGTADQALDGLALAPRSDGGPGLFGLPDDQRFFTDRGQPQRAGRVVQAFELSPRSSAGALAQRFALASVPIEGDAVLLPLGSGAGFATGLGARAIDLPPLRRDGMDRFDWSLFAEPALAGIPADALADQAEALRLLGPVPQPLRGMHCAFGAAVDGLTEEPTLLVVPDAVQPGWVRTRRRQPAWRVLPAAPQPAAEASGEFAGCALVPLAAPQFVRGADPDAGGNFTLQWTEPEAGLHYLLQESSDAGFGAASTAYSGADRHCAVTGKARGVLFYRLQASAGARLSAWSAAVAIHVGVTFYELRPWQADDLKTLHRLMLRTAAGRGDMLAVLGLPQDYRWSDAVAHAAALRDDLADEERALSHGTLQHPWLLTRRTDEVAPCPPDGAVAGQLASGALERGAWIAVANRPLADVVAVALAAGTADRQALLEAQVNPVFGSPIGFVLGSAETLVADADWRPVNVRRLMSLLRRAALRRGATYVFEPNGDALRRTVERAFEALLDELFRRGAFAGRRAGEAYRVEVGDAVNTDARRDAGQFWVELKVAPALPLTFLSVRLVRSGDRITSQDL